MLAHCHKITALVKQKKRYFNVDLNFFAINTIMVFNSFFRQTQGNTLRQAQDDNLLTAES